MLKQRLTILYLLSLIGFILMGTFVAHAAFNPQINYQAKLTDTSGVAVTDDDYNMQFKLWNHETATSGANLIWTGTCTSTNQISVTSGLFSHLLGGCNSLSGVDFNQTLYLGVNIGGTSSPAWDGEMAPRKKIGAVPAAFEADKLDGLDSTSFLRSDANDTATGTLTFEGTLNINNATNTLSGSSYFYLAGGTTYYIDNTGSAVLNTLEVATTTLSKKLTVSSGGANITGGLTTDTLTSTTSTLGTVTSGTWQGTAIGTQYGGTGQDWSSETAGKLPYFSATGTLSTLAAGTNNYLLYSNNGTPAWTNTPTLTELTISGTTTLNSVPYLWPGSDGNNTQFLQTDGTGNLAWATSTSGYWNQTGSDIYYNTGNVGIGTSSPDASLHIEGSLLATGTTTFNTTAYSWPSSDGGENQVLTTDGSGSLSWTASGGGEGSCPADMVKLGDLCVDKYEVSIWSTASGGTQYGATSDNYPCSDTGNDCSEDASNPIYARSVSGVNPARYVTWFQAAQACHNAGKRLLTNAEWQQAAAGTPDPDSSDPGDDSEECNIWDNSKPSGATWATTNETIETGSAASCVSNWGAYDMVGNVWEWTADWWGADSSTNGLTTNATYGSDYMYDVDPADNQGGGSNFPAASLRGGGWSDGSAAGVFALYLDFSPSSSGSTVGFRCCKDLEGGGSQLVDGGDFLYPADASGQEALALGGESTSTAEVYLNHTGDSWLTGGNVGIGTTSPDTKLHIIGTTTVAGNILPETDNQYTLGESTSLRWANIYTATATIGNTITIGSNTLEGSATTTLFTTSNANQLTLGSNGNVGIGTTSPSSLLTVGASTGSQFLINATGTITSGTWQGTAIGTQYGGTGQDWSAIATGSLPYFSSKGVMGTIATGTTDQILTMNGGLPSWQDAAAGGLFTDAGSFAYLSSTTDDLVLGASATSSSNIWFDVGGQMVKTGSGDLTVDTAGNLIISDKLDLDVSSASGYALDINNTSSSGYAARFQVNSSDIMTIGDPNVTISNPLSIEAAGDTGIAYDLQFTNLTSSYVNSYAPLTIQAGTDNDSYNLTLKSAGTGDVIAGSDLLPDTDNTHTLGSSSYRWSALYAATTSVGDLVFANDFRVTEHFEYPQALKFLNPDNQEIARLDENGQFNINKLSLNTGTSSLDARLNIQSVSTSSTSTVFQILNPDQETLLSVKDDGKIGIGFEKPTVKLDVAGVIRADDYLTYTEDFTGDAIAILKEARTRNLKKQSSKENLENKGKLSEEENKEEIVEKNEENQEEDTKETNDLKKESGKNNQEEETTQKNNKENWAPVDHNSWPEEIINEYIVNESCNNLRLPEHAECEDLEDGTAKVYARSLTALSSINTRAIQQLIDKIETIEIKLTKEGLIEGEEDNTELEEIEDSETEPIQNVEELDFANTTSSNLLTDSKDSWLASLVNVFKRNWNLVVGKLEAVFVKSDKIETRELVIQQTDNNEEEPSKVSMVGSGKIGEAEMRAKVYNPTLQKSSKIFVTFNSDLMGRSWYIGERSIILGDDPNKRYFTVELSSPAPSDLEFDYWIIQISQEASQDDKSNQTSRNSDIDQENDSDAQESKLEHDDEYNQDLIEKALKILKESSSTTSMQNNLLENNNETDEQKDQQENDSNNNNIQKDGHNEEQPEKENVHKQQEDYGQTEEDISHPSNTSATTSETDISSSNGVVASTTTSGDSVIQKENSSETETEEIVGDQNNQKNINEDLKQNEQTENINEENISANTQENQNEQKEKNNEIENLNKLDFENATSN